nr:MAG: hypothetical protein 1 [Salisharnavirus sp.]
MKCAITICTRQSYGDLPKDSIIRSNLGCRVLGGILVLNMSISENSSTASIAETMASLDVSKVRASEQYTEGIREVFKARKEQRSLGKVCQSLADIKELEDLIGDISFGDNGLFLEKEANQKKYQRKNKNGGKRSNKKEQQRRRARNYAKLASLVPHSGRGQPGRGRPKGGFGRGGKLRPGGRVQIQSRHWAGKDRNKPTMWSEQEDMAREAAEQAAVDALASQPATPINCDALRLDEESQKIRDATIEKHKKLVASLKRPAEGVIPEATDDEKLINWEEYTTLTDKAVAEQIEKDLIKHAEAIPTRVNCDSPNTGESSVTEEEKLPQQSQSEDPKKFKGLSDLLSSLHGISEAFANTDNDIEYWISHLENIIILGYNMNKAESMTDIIFAIAGFCKMISNRSIIGDVLRCIDEALGPNDEVAPEGWDLKEFGDNWHLFKSNPMFIKISYLISAAMSLSICQVKNVEWSPFGLKLIAIEAAKEQLNAIDVFDALVKTYSWIAETGYQVMQEGSLTPILYADNKMRKFNEECDYLLAHAEAILNGNGEISVQDFEFRVDAIMRQVAHMKSLKDTGPTAVWLQQRYSTLVDIKWKIVAKYRNTAIREAPFGMGLVGSTSVGKSTLSKLVMKTAICAMGYEFDPARIMTKDMFDKFDSTYTSDILGVYMDDVGNGKPQYTITSPTDVIIKFFNNMAAQAVKAELNAKGVVFINFKVGVMSSNFEDYNVSYYTEKPEACLRRFYHTRVKTKPGYTQRGGVSLETAHPELNKEEAALFHDVWELTLLEIFVFKGVANKDTYVFRPMRAILDGKEFECTDLDLPTYLRVVAHLAIKHQKLQRKLVERSEKFDKMEMCKACYLPEPMCICKKPEPHSMEYLQDVVVQAGKRAFWKSVRGWFSPISMINSLVGYKPISLLATKTLESEMSEVIDRTTIPLVMAYTPTCVFNSNFFQRMANSWQRSAALYDLKNHLRVASLLTLGSFAYGVICPKEVGRWAPLGVLSYISTLCCFSHYQVRLNHYREVYNERRDALPTYVQNLRDNTVPKGVAAIAGVLVAVKLLQWWNRQRISNLEPASSTLEPDNLKRSPGWFGFMMDKLGVTVDVSESCKKAVPVHLISTFKKSNLHWADFERANRSMTRCNIFFPRKGVAWFPKHIFYEKADMETTPSPYVFCTVSRHDGPGGSFKFRIALDQCSELPHLDLVCCFVPNCPDMKTKLKFLPQSLLKGNSLCTFVVHDGDEIITEQVSVKHEATGHKYRKFYGGSYNSQNARVGACMGLLILNQKDPVIAGFHIGGSTSGNFGVMQTVTREDADKLIDLLAEKPGVFLTAEAGTLPEKQFGRPILKSTEIHPHCMANHLRASDFVEVIGSTNLRTSQTSRVVTSILSPHVEEICGVANAWGPPQLKPNWKAYNATLEHVINPSDMFCPLLLERAKRDWLKPILPLLDEFCKSDTLKPLTDKEAILGIDGVRFVDALPMDTGMGFPVFGPKKRHFDEIRDGEKLIDRIPHQEIIEEKERLLACYRRGERGYPICTATLKDEPTKLTSEKVRVFQAAPIALSLLIRKYYLPLARFLCLHPLQSECAVGINAFSLEWNDIMSHVEEFAFSQKWGEFMNHLESFAFTPEDAGEGMVLAFDYSKYDVRIHSQMTTAVFSIYYELAKRAGYSSEDLHIMRMMTSDIVHPLLDWNGTLLMAFNMNTSGNNMTVMTNSIAGSLFVRMGFFSIHPEVQNFRDKVRCSTYGDDFIGTVRYDCRDFNFETYRDFLASHNMKITLPNKTTESAKFLPREKADFLKRKSYFIPEIGCNLGQLDEMSIFKSLHCNLKSKVALPHEVAAGCIETALHEWFAYGREHYEMRARQMRELCKRVDLPVPATNVTFDERVAHWKEKYLVKAADT